MFETKSSIYIDRSPQDVFNVITDPDTNSLWQTMTESVEFDSNGSPGVGSTMNVVARFLGRKMEMKIEVTAWEPPQRFDWKIVNGPYPSEVSNRIEAQGEGALLTSVGQGEPGGFFKLAEGLVARQLEKQLDTNYETLKLLMESGQL
jgi:uncharacterized protein YndB with AHSA1/START domain